MNADYQLEHAQLGMLYVRRNPRARKFIFRYSADGLLVTAPVRSTQKDLLSAVDSLLPRLLQLRAKAGEKKIHRIDSSFTITTTDFVMRVQEGDVPRACAQLNKGILVITCPHGTNYENESLQQWMITVAEASLRALAKRIFQLRLDELSRRSNLPYAGLKIQKSHGRWGSCSTRRNINLSLYLLLVPRHLQDYVMLHELCHTKEMNHSDRFWSLLNSLTGGKALALRKELQAYDTSIFSSLRAET